MIIPIYLVCKFYRKMYTGLYTPFHPKCVGYLHFLSLLFSFLITNSTISSVKMSTTTWINSVSREKDKYKVLYNLSYTKSYIPVIIITTISELESWETDGSTGRETWGTAEVKVRERERTARITSSYFVQCSEVLPYPKACAFAISFSKAGLRHHLLFVLPPVQVYSHSVFMTTIYHCKHTII